jgi:UDP-N-acetylglucosamine diphosphorylase / glucose-1-phosphate thymidylyltransferase / UDP-N-acetylgalactosamine diphosphorylase / glucosamine-1-phosphate N-acetyltransferase / galactosamine-1-phosphate N-acetyltransferase
VRFFHAVKAGIITPARKPEGNFNMKAVIMAAGKSTRTWPLTLTRPKPLLPVLNKTILEHQMEALAESVDGFVLVVGYRHEMIRERFGDSWRGKSIEYVEQTEQRGTGHAILQCAPCLTEPFLAMNGDDIYCGRDLARLAAADQAALAMEVDDPRLYGIYEVDEENRVIRLVEKPKEVFSNLANIGAYKFTPEVFAVLENTPLSERGEIEITSAIQRLAETSEFRVVRAEGHWLPIGYPWHLIDAAAWLFDNRFEPEILGEVHPQAVIEGPVHIGKGTVIRPGAVIEGPVCIGEDCRIGPNCWIRPYSTLGNGCKVGQASEIKNSILMNGAAAPHQNYVGDSILGENTNLGCGTVTANFRHDGRTHGSVVKGALVDTGRRKLGAIIGDDVHTGILTAIYPGRKLWPHTFTRPNEIVDRDIIGNE